MEWQEKVIIVKEWLNMRHQTQEAGELCGTKNPFLDQNLLHK